MYSTGHIIFIIISCFLITLGVGICVKKKMSTEKVLWACFLIGVICEVVKVFSVDEFLFSI
jgi:hypothetical protein